MPIKILHPDHTELVGLGYVLLVAPHATGVDKDLHTGQLVEDAALASRAYAVIGKTGSAYQDQDRLQSVRVDFRRSIDGIIEENGIKCVLNVRGRKESGVDVGTGQGKTATDDISGIVRIFLSRNFTVTRDKYQGVKPDGAEDGYEKIDAKGGFAVQSVQISFGLEELQTRRDKIVDDLAELVGLVNVKLGFQLPATTPVSSD
jgi:hypothetical protein